MDLQVSLNNPIVIVAIVPIFLLVILLLLRQVALPWIARLRRSRATKNMKERIDAVNTSWNELIVAIWYFPRTGMAMIEMGLTTSIIRSTTDAVSGLNNYLESLTILSDEDFWKGMAELDDVVSAFNEAVRQMWSNWAVCKYKIEFIHRNSPET